MDQEVAEKNDFADRLVAALRKDEFALYRQVIVPLAPTGAERPFQEILIRFEEEETIKMSPRVGRNIDQDPASAATAEAIQRKCSTLGIITIAEHVESDRVLAQLRRIGVDYAQGYGILPPQPLA